MLLFQFKMAFKALEYTIESYSFNENMSMGEKAKMLYFSELPGVLATSRGATDEAPALGT
jgi:hypothetical protein